MSNIIPSNFPATLAPRTEGGQLVPICHSTRYFAKYVLQLGETCIFHYGQLLSAALVLWKVIDDCRLYDGRFKVGCRFRVKGADFRRISSPRSLILSITLDPTFNASNLISINECSCFFFVEVDFTCLLYL